VIVTQKLTASEVQALIQAEADAFDVGALIDVLDTQIHTGSATFTDTVPALAQSRVIRAVLDEYQSRGFCVTVEHMGHTWYGAPIPTEVHPESLPVAYKLMFSISLPKPKTEKRKEPRGLWFALCSVFWGGK
jgi:hypothetical protein